jgi:hypothetical protein
MGKLTHLVKELSTFDTIELAKDVIAALPPEHLINVLADTHTAGKLGALSDALSARSDKMIDAEYAAHAREEDQLADAQDAAEEMKHNDDEV